MGALVAEGEGSDGVCHHGGTGGTMMTNCAKRKKSLFGFEEYHIF